MLLSELVLKDGLFLSVLIGKETEGSKTNELANRIEKLEKFRCGFCSYVASRGHSRYCNQYRRAIEKGLQDDWDN